MKVVIITGIPGSCLEQVGEILNSAGLLPPVQPAKNELSVNALHEQMQNADKIDRQSNTVQQSAQLKGVWEKQARDILQSNLGQEAWGWTNPLTTGLLDFWKSLNKNIYFVLVYSSPEEDIARSMQEAHESHLLCEVAADSWFSYNAQLLRFFNRNREQCILVGRSASSVNSSKLLSRCNESFGLSLKSDLSKTTFEKQKQDCVGIILARNFLEDRGDIYSLYNEMQATATLPYDENSPVHADTAWSMYRQTQHTFLDQHEKRKLLEQNSIEIERQQKKCTSKLTDQIRLSEKTQLEINQCKKENELSLLQLQQVQKELGETLLNNEKYRKECVDQVADQTRLLEEKQTSIDEFKKKVKSLQGEIDNNNLKVQSISAEQSEHLQGKIRELEQENELLLLQLHQVQEELEHYFLLHQGRAPKQEEQQVQTRSDGRLHLKMADLSLDANWYGVEKVDGVDLRWSGPAPRAAVRVSMKRDQKQLLVIQYKQVLAKKQLKGIRIEMNGEAVSHKVYDRITPKCIVVELNASTEELSNETELALVLPYTVKPTDINPDSPDERPLGISVYGISLLPLEPRLRMHWPETFYGLWRLKRYVNKTGTIDTFPLAYFDGKAYLQKYPDVAELVRQGSVVSAVIHYVQKGRYNNYDFVLADTGLPSEGNKYDLMQID